MSAVSAPFHCCPRAPAWYFAESSLVNICSVQTSSGIRWWCNCFPAQNRYRQLVRKNKIFCRGTQFKVNRNKSQLLWADERVGTTSKIKILGLYHGLTLEAYEENIKLLEKILSDSEKFFTKFMSLRAKTIVMNTFCVSRLMNIARHIKVPRTLIEKFQSLSLKALWGEGKKTEVAPAIFNVKLPTVELAGQT